VLADSPVRTAKDLEGKTLAAVSLSDMNSVATFAWLDSQGVDRSTLKYVEFPASASLAAMQQNRIVASTIYEPYFSSYMSSGKVRVLAYPFGAIAKHFSDALIFTTTKWAADHPNEVKKFLAATEEASTYIAAHENLSSQLIAEFGAGDDRQHPPRRPRDRAEPVRRSTRDRHGVQVQGHPEPAARRRHHLQLRPDEEVG
jgi:NitT/TauT family transport system substrate-binding protein